MHVELKVAPAGQADPGIERNKADATNQVTVKEAGPHKLSLDRDSTERTRTSDAWS